MDVYRSSDACIFWTKDESDTDVSDMAHRSAYVPGVTDTMSGQRRDVTTQAHVSLQNKAMIYQGSRKKEHIIAKKVGKKGENATQKIQERRSPAKEDPQGRPSLKDLRPEDKKRVANLVRELAKIGEEKEVAMEQLQVERRENDMKTRELQTQVAIILKERENVQQQYLECQKLLSQYQSRVASDGSGSQQGGSSKIFHEGNPLNGGWSPIKESSMIPTSDRPPSSAHQTFVQLQPVPDSEEHTPDIAPRKINTSSHHIHPDSVNTASGSHDDQFAPALSSTHRPHQQSRVPGNRPGNVDAIKRDRLGNEVKREQTYQYQLSPSVQERNRLQKQQDSNGQDYGDEEPKTNRMSQDTFKPLPEMEDASRTHSRQEDGKHSNVSSRMGIQSQAWATLPEIEGQPPFSYEFHERSLPCNDGQQPRESEPYLGKGPTAVPQAGGPRDRADIQRKISYPYRDHHDVGEPEVKQQFSENTHHTPSQPDSRRQQERDRYQDLTPDQRQQELGLLRKKLQQEQAWLQHKLGEQEQLLQQKQLEVEMQKLQLLQLSRQSEAHSSRMLSEHTGYEGVRRKYLDARTGSYEDDEEAEDTGYVHGYIPSRTGHHSASKGRHLGKHQNAVIEEIRNGIQIMSTRYPPESAEGRFQNGAGVQEMTRGRGADDGLNGHGSYLDYDEGDGVRNMGAEEEENAWYEMREETDVDADGRNAQGYAPVHHSLDRRKHGTTTHPVAVDQSTPLRGRLHHNAGSAYMPNHPMQSAKGVSPARYRQPVQQFGNLTALLEEEDLINQTSPGYTSPYRHPPPPGYGTHRDQGGGMGVMLHPTPPSYSQQGYRAGGGYPGGGRVGYTPGDGRRDQLTNGIYQSHQMTQRGPARSSSSTVSSKQTHAVGKHQTGAAALRGSGRDHAPDGAGQSHLVQRSHQVIRDIGRLLEETSEVGEEEESQVLEDIFFLKG